MSIKNLAVMNRYFRLSACALLLLLFCCNSTSSKKSPLSHDQMMATASRSEKNGWIVVHLEGAPEVIGYQHGYLLANEIIDLRGAMAMQYKNSTGKNWDFYRIESDRLFWKNIPDEYQKELDGIVSGVNAKLGNGKIDRKDIIAMNSILEMSDYYVPLLDAQNDPKQPAPAPAGHCSAFAATGSWTKDGRIVMAHNNWSDYVTGERWNIILDIIPEKGNRIIMDAPPGFIHSGDDFFINSSGLIVTETTISQFNGFDTTGVAEFVRARKAIQYATSIDEWAAIMTERNNGGYANDWLIGDNKTGEIACLELGLKNQIMEKSKDGYYIGSNFPVNEKLIKEETTFDVTDLANSANARKIRWEEIMKEDKGKIDVNAAMKYMGDHYDTWRKKEQASALTLCGHVDVDEAGVPIWDSSAFEPSGAVQGKATDARLASDMKFWAIMGHPCGEPFIASEFLAAHPEYSYQKDFLRDMPGQIWTLFGKTTR
jgi:hypothetical protein